MVKKGTHLSEETKFKLSKLKKGIKTGIIKKTSFKKGQIPWNKGIKGGTGGSFKIGHKHSLETIEKLRTTLKGKPSPNKGKPNLKLRGVNNPAYKGNKSSSRLRIIINGMPEYSIWRSRVFQRDNWTCQTCGKRGKLDPHHIIAVSKIIKVNNLLNVEDSRNCKELWNIDNGVTLCRECHKLTSNYGHRKDK